MNKYLLPILAAGAIASVSQAQTLTPIALELWEFEDAAGLSFEGTPTEDNPNPTGFANSGSHLKEHPLKIVQIRLVSQTLVQMAPYGTTEILVLVHQQMEVVIL